MCSKPADSLRADKPRRYEIKVEGRLDQDWSDWLGRMTLTAEAPGLTVLTGLVPDQAALYGLLARLRDLGLALVSVNRLA